MTCHATQPSLGMSRKAIHSRWHTNRTAFSCLSALACAAAGMLPAGIHAQTWIHEATVDATAGATTNASLSADGAQRKDLITSLTPGIRVRGQGSNIDLSLEAHASLVAYARGSQQNQILPTGQATLKATLVDRFLFLDSFANVSQVEVDPYAVRTEDGKTANRRTATEYRIAPYFQHEFSPLITILARQEESGTHQTAGGSTDRRSKFSLFRLDSKPSPVGFGVDLSKLDNESSDQAGGRLLVKAMRAWASVALGGETIFGAVLGTERSEFLLDKQSDKLYGMTLQWLPGPRTDLQARLEHRFFGTGGELNLRHRTQSTSLSVQAIRGPVSAPSSLIILGSGANVAAFLDAILTSGFPDPIQRAAAVNDLISSRGLKATLPASIDIGADYPQLQTLLSATWVLLLGKRDTLAVSAYGINLRQLTRPDRPVAVPTGLVADNRQSGGVVEINHRLTPQTTLDAVARFSSIDGLATRAGDYSKQTSYRFSLVYDLSPRTGMSTGIQYKVIRGNAGIVPKYSESLAFVGIDHRF